MSDSLYKAIIAVPAYFKDQLDFAKKYHLPILYVLKDSIGNLIKIKQYKKIKKISILCNSNQFNELNFHDGIQKISKFLISNNIGKKVVHYRLKDWCISRQRFWGAPIPIVTNKNGKIITISENELPVLLPKKRN